MPRNCDRGAHRFAQDIDTRGIISLTAAAGLGIGAISTAHADPPLDRCVTTTQELAQAIADAEWEPLRIEIQQSSEPYDMTQVGTKQGGRRSFYLSHGTSLLGGYVAATSCGSRDIAAGNTILSDGDPSESILIQPAGGGSENDPIIIEGVTFEITGGTQLFTYSAPFEFRRNVVRHTSTKTDYSSGGIFFNMQNPLGTVNIVDNLFVDNTSDGCVVEVYAGSITAPTPPDIQLVNNTIANNAVANGLCVDDITSAQDAAYGIYNNIVYGNAAPDLKSEATNLVLENNTIGAYEIPASVNPVNQLSGDPKLDANYRPIESPVSPSVNSGTADVLGGLPGTDLGGRARVIGSAPDRGAYESSVNDLAGGFVVTNTNDSGPGSLRQAITDANNSLVPIVTFDIGNTCGPHVIEVTSAPLPKILVPMLIDGYSQPGSSRNTQDTGWDANLCIVIEDGATWGRGLQVAGDAPGGTSGAHLQLTGVAFSGFGTAAVDIEANDSHQVYGNQFGGFVGSTALQSNGVNIRVGGSASGVRIGGDDPSARNLVNAASGNGIEILNGSHDNAVTNNYIGVGWSSTYTQRGNAGKGIYVNGHGNTIDDNLIGNNEDDGIDLDGLDTFSNSVSYGNVISGNAIGVSADGTNLANGSMGVRIDSAHDNTIMSNTIAYNGQKGVRVISGTGNRISRNSIYKNALLGIDLAGDGVTANDTDTTAATWIGNRGQNFPVLTQAIGDPLSGVFHGSLTSSPGVYTIEFFTSPSCDALGNGDGKTWRASAQVAILAAPQGTVAFDVAHNAGVTMVDSVVTATATDANGNTSEFSNCVLYESDQVFGNGFE